MKTPRFSGPFKWSAIRQQLLSLREDVQSIQKVAGRNVTIDEHRGKGTVINVFRKTGLAIAGATGACCVDTECSVTTEADCASAGGTYQGDGTTCDPNPCAGGGVGACCTDGTCSEVTQEECESGGGYFYGVGTTCAGRVCDEGVPCSSVGLSVTNSFSSTVSSDPGHCLDWNVTGHEQTHEFTQDELNHSTPASGFEDCQTGCNGDPFIVFGVTYYYTNGNSVGWYFRASFDCVNRTVSVEVARSISCKGCTPGGCPDDCSPFNACESNWDKIYTISLDEPGEHTFDDDITNGSGFTAHFTTSITLTI